MTPDARRPWPARLSVFYGWVILPVAGLGLFISGPGQTYSISVFVEPIIQDMGLSRTAVSGLYTAGSLSAAGAMVLVGQLLDRYGARVMLCAAATFLGLAALWMSFVDNAAGLFVGFAALRVFGQGTLTLVPSTLIALWFIRRRGRATALGSLGTVLSGAAFPWLIHVFISQVGWRTAWLLLGLIVWATVPVFALLVRRTPESVGLRPDGEGAPLRDAGAQGDARQVVEGWTRRQAMRTRTFLLLLVATSTQSLITTALVFHKAALLGSSGLGAGTTAAVLSIMAPSSLAGTFAAGFLSDKVANRRLLVAGQILLLVSLAAALLVAVEWQALAYGVLLGFASGFMITLSAVVWPDYYGRRDLGSIRGVATMAMVAGAALGPLPFAFVQEATGSYDATLGVFAVLPLVALLAALGVRRPSVS